MVVVAWGHSCDVMPEGPKPNCFTATAVPQLPCGQREAQVATNMLSICIGTSSFLEISSVYPSPCIVHLVYTKNCMYGISSCTTLTAPAVYTVVRVPNKASVPHWGHFHCSFTLVGNKYSNVVSW